MVEKQIFNFAFQIKNAKAAVLHFHERQPLLFEVAEPTGLEPATSDVTGRRSNQLNYDSTAKLRFSKVGGSVRCSPLNW